MVREGAKEIAEARMSDEKDRENRQLDHQKAEEQTTSSAGKAADQFLKRLGALPFLPIAPEETPNEEPRPAKPPGRKILERMG